MPHYRCPACRVTTHSVGGHSTLNTCPNCSAPLAGSDRIYVGGECPNGITCALAVEPEAAPAARRVLAALLRDGDDTELEIAALLMTELIANSVRHSGAGADGTIRLDIAVTDDLLRIEVGDDGAGFVPVARTADSPVDSQWGLHLIDELATSWGVAPEPQGRVWFELARSAPAPLPTREIVAMIPGQATFDEAGDHVH